MSKTKILRNYHTTLNAYFSYDYQYLKRYVPLPFRLVRKLRRKHDANILEICATLKVVGLPCYVSAIHALIKDAISGMHAQEDQETYAEAVLHRVHSYITNKFNELQLIEALDETTAHSLALQIRKLGDKIQAKTRIMNLHSTNEQYFPKYFDVLAFVQSQNSSNIKVDDEEDFLSLYKVKYESLGEFYKTKRRKQFRKKLLFYTSVVISIIMAICEAAIAFHYAKLGLLTSLAFIVLPALLLNFYVFITYTLATFKDLGKQNPLSSKIIFLASFATSVIWSMLTINSLTDLLQTWLHSTSLPLPILLFCGALSLVAFVNNFAAFYITGKEFCAYWNKKNSLWSKALPRILALIIALLLAFSIYLVSAGVFHTQTIEFLINILHFSPVQAKIFAFIVTQLFAQPLNGIFYIAATMKGCYKIYAYYEEFKFKECQQYWSDVLHNIKQDPVLAVPYVLRVVWFIVVL